MDTNEIKNITKINIQKLEHMYSMKIYIFKKWLIIYIIIWSIEFFKIIK